MVSRSFDQVIERVTVTTTPNHLWSRIIIRTRENESREQRHRYFSISSFLEVARQLDRGSDLGDAAKEPPNVGQFADIPNRPRYHEAREYLQVLGGAVMKKAIKSQKKDPKDFKYQDSTQKRGRPSTTIIVHDAHNGDRNRGIIGSIPVQPDLPARLVYDSKSGLVMRPSPMWSGKGAHPPFTEEQRREGKEPAWYDRYPHVKERAIPRNSKKARGKERSEVGRGANAGAVSNRELRQTKRIKGEVNGKEDAVARSSLVDDTEQHVPVIGSGLSEASKEVAKTLVNLSSLSQPSEPLSFSSPTLPPVLSVHSRHEGSSGPLEIAASKECSDGGPRFTKSFTSSASPVDPEPAISSFTHVQAKIVEGDVKRKSTLVPASEQPPLKLARLVKGEETTNLSAGEVRYNPDQRAVSLLSPASAAAEVAMPALSPDGGGDREGTPLREMPPSISLTPVPARLKRGRSSGSTNRKSSSEQH